MLLARHRPAVTTPGTTPGKSREGRRTTSPLSTTTARQAAMSSTSPARGQAATPKKQVGSSATAQENANDDFSRWRPSFHMIAPKNWMNDPCGPCYDPKTGLFHLLYQYNPLGAIWGNMTWMHATSRDLVHWRHVKDEPTLVPSQAHDKEGVFSGSMLTTGPHGEEGQLTVIYTAISRLPIHYTKPYTPGSEKLAIAVSHDDGKTWQTSQSSIVLPGPPDHLADQTVSWRDPFLGPWPAMDQALGLQSGHGLYGMISGSLRDKSPTVFLYSIDRTDVSKWTFVSHLADIGLNYQLNDFSGDMGQNWEVCNFFADNNESFLLLNVEGVDGNPKKRHAIWTKVKVHMVGRKSAGVDAEPKVAPQYSSLIDHGCLYAATTFVHEPTGRRLLWGWVTEDDLAEHRYDQQGWSGCMSLPREVFTLTFKDVDVQQLLRPVFSHSFWPVMETDPISGRRQALKIATLGVRPAGEVVKLREGAKHFAVQAPSPSYTLPIASRNFELIVDIDMTSDADLLQSRAGEIGVIIAHNAARTAQTEIVYSPQDEMLRVDRSKSSTDRDVDISTKTAPLGLVRNGDGSIETLRMRMFLDNSVLEVFVNDRVALTTRIYCDTADCNLVSLQADPSLLGHTGNQDGSKITAPIASFTHLEAWFGLQNAMLPTEAGLSTT